MWSTNFSQVTELMNKNFLVVRPVEGCVDWAPVGVVGILTGFDIGAILAHSSNQQLNLALQKILYKKKA